ncbi:hypothetical protein J3R30DRAFT_122387 [Lentinula aciculospora]|uniref:Uncharacterized protein n=1 Tax=Lentinula aciculospora TaxID=153920 RepID=A0A9W9AVH1_9AGAR|nr:hypothetical protein J3R30DRAFT_122387 [Lentinula aciculospora]
MWHNMLSTFDSARLGIASVLLLVSSAFHVHAIPATRTVTLFDVNAPDTSTPSIPTPPSTPTVVFSYSVIGTTTKDGNTMTIYGENVIFSEYVEGYGGIVSGTALASEVWSTRTLSSPQTIYETFAVGANVFEFSQSNDSFDDPLFFVDCSFDSAESSRTGVCTERIGFPQLSSTETTTWTGSVIPFATFSVSVSATATTSVTDAAGSLRGRQWPGLLAGVVLTLLAVILL